MATKRILVIEDDPDVREALTEALSASGLDVAVALDGVDGLERLREGARPVAILLDLRLPRLGGEAFLRELRADPRFEHVPVITMTAGEDAPDDREVLAHLHKPFDIEDVRRLVLSLCEVAAA